MNLLEAKKKQYEIKDITAGFLAKRNLKSRGIEEGIKIEKIAEVGDAVKIKVNGKEEWIGSDDVEEIVVA
jgi:Fe2+ transport system protein FeoA